MAFDNAKYNAPATRGDVARIALHTSIAIANIRWSLQTIAADADVDVTQNILEVERALKTLDKVFDDLTGWTADEPA